MLCQGPKIYWVSDATSSRINSLVEYPLTTVVLVIKPPGSELEFELKRAGRKGDNPFTVVFRRPGYRVAPSHRLDGGSMQWLLRYEARSGGEVEHDLIAWSMAAKRRFPVTSRALRSFRFRRELDQSAAFQILH